MAGLAFTRSPPVVGQSWALTLLHAAIERATTESLLHINTDTIFLHLVIGKLSNRAVDEPTQKELR